MYKFGWSPLDSDILRSRVTATFVDGQLKFREAKFFGQPTVCALNSIVHTNRFAAGLVDSGSI